MSVLDAWRERRSGSGRHADDARDDFEVDYARVVHSGAFRRLQGKTQILSLGDDDFYRTRLTHSLEVAQIAEGILQHLRRGAGQPVPVPPDPLIRALGLAHDIGHPPFGHGGETALNYCMRDHGGFEGNAQTFRLLAHLEPYTSRCGADLTRRTLLGLLKYPALRSSALNPEMRPGLLGGPSLFRTLDEGSCKPVKACYDVDADLFAWVLEPLSQADRDAFTQVAPRAGGHAKTLHKSVDCSIMDAADDIAYGVHDLEDALALGLIDADHFADAVPPDVCRELLAGLADRPVDGVGVDYPGFVAGLFGPPGCRKRLIGRLVHHLIRATRIERLGSFEDPLLDCRLVLDEAARPLLDALQKLISRRVIDSAAVQHLEFKGKRMVVAVFEALMTAPAKLLPEPVAGEFASADGDPRVVCDYLAALTDAGLLRLYDRLFSPRGGTVFDRL